MPLARALVVAALTMLLMVGAAGCIDPIDLDVGEPENRLVVNALVTDGPGPHRVVLSRSGAFTQGLDALRPPETGALVIVEAGDGIEVVFEELSSPTRYESPPGELVGEVGQTYLLRVVLTDGTEYRSSAITMEQAPEILDLRSALVHRTRLEGDVVVDDPQIELRIDTPSGAGISYYRWAWRGTYSREACYRPNPGSPIEFCDRCYLDAASTSLVEIGDDALAAGTLTDQLAVSFPISQHGFRFVPAFQVVVEQQALTPEAYSFWSLIREARDNVGSLFDPPPEAILGNMVNVDDPLDRALGYFTVAGTSTETTCVRRDDFDDFPSFPASPPIAGQCGVNVAGSLTPPPGFVENCARD